ncbi:U11/U12 small nuclear ribonucleoprotein 48 kDa protein [Quaeritorhiza haematococci]|nr:U11/U12 small nuclear ribonucleoprotein 48 kDa protein [Quaeritorhiza haematococci]
MAQEGDGLDDILERVQKRKAEQAEDDKSKLQKLADQRDYKRRRKSYRAKNVHLTQRTPTQVFRDLIAAYMEEIANNDTRSSPTTIGAGTATSGT